MQQLALAAGLYAGPVAGDKTVPACGWYDPARGVVAGPAGEGPAVAVTFYRSYLTAADTDTDVDATDTDDVDGDADDTPSPDGQDDADPAVDTDAADAQEREPVTASTPPRRVRTPASAVRAPPAARDPLPPRPPSSRAPCA